MNAESTQDYTDRSESAVSNSPASTRCMMISELRWKIFDLLTSVATPFRHVSTATRLSEFEWVIDSLG
jgi:hypothetical protein